MSHPGLLALLGHPVAHSLSPTFQNAALRAAGIPLRYEALDVPPDKLDAVLDNLRRAQGAGNVTIPHKVAFAARCDRLTPTALVTGAVNTFWHEGATLVGDNTDVEGFHALAQRVFAAPLANAQVAVIGVGGAAAAVCAAALQWPAGSVRVWGRRQDAADALAARFGPPVVVATSASAALADATLVVNATPIGMTDDAMPFPLDLLPRDAAVTDLVYRRGETALVRAARQRGHRAADGLEMLVEQGAHAFLRWFGIPPSRDAMWESLR